jgi:hypothetical protein
LYPGFSHPAAAGPAALAVRRGNRICARKIAAILIVHHTVGFGLQILAQTGALLEPTAGVAVPLGDRPGFVRRALGTVIGLAQLATDGRNHHLLPSGHGARFGGLAVRSRNCGVPPVRTGRALLVPAESLDLAACGCERLVALFERCSGSVDLGLVAASLSEQFSAQGSD